LFTYEKQNVFIEGATMKRSEVLSTVITLINKARLSTKEINASDRLVEDLGLDSIGFVELGTSLEEKYLISISDELLESLSTVEMVVDVVLSSPSYATEADAEVAN
jgi:acyl carrier protein